MPFPLSQMANPDKTRSRFGLLVDKCHELGIEPNKSSEVMRGRIVWYEEHGNLDGYEDEILEKKLQKKRENLAVLQAKQAVQRAERKAKRDEEAAQFPRLDLHAPLGQTQFILRTNGFLMAKDGNMMELDDPPMIMDNQEEELSYDCNGDESGYETNEDSIDAKSIDLKFVGSEDRVMGDNELQTIPQHQAGATQTRLNESSSIFVDQKELSKNRHAVKRNTSDRVYRLEPIKSSAAQWHSNPRLMTRASSRSLVKTKLSKLPDFTEPELIRICDALKLKAAGVKSQLLSRVLSYHYSNHTPVDFFGILGREPPPSPQLGKLSNPVIQSLSASETRRQNRWNSPEEEHKNNTNAKNVKKFLIDASNLTRAQIIQICVFLKLRTNGQREKLIARIQHHQNQLKHQLNLQEILKRELPPPSRLPKAANMGQSSSSAIIQQPLPAFETLDLGRLNPYEQQVSSIEDNSRPYESASITSLSNSGKDNRDISDFELTELSEICIALSLSTIGRRETLITRILLFQEKLQKSLDFSKILESGQSGIWTDKRLDRPERPTVEFEDSLECNGKTSRINLPITTKSSMKETDFTIEDLLHICIVLGLGTHGKKKQLVTRIQGYEQAIGAALDFTNILSTEILRRAKRRSKKSTMAEGTQLSLSTVPQKQVTPFEPYNPKQQAVIQQSPYGQASAHESFSYDPDNGFGGNANMGTIEIKPVRPGQMATDYPNPPSKPQTSAVAGYGSATTNIAPFKPDQFEFTSNKCGHLTGPEVVHLCQIYGLETGGSHGFGVRQLEEYQLAHMTLIDLEAVLRLLPPMNARELKLPRCKRCEEFKLICDHKRPCSRCLSDRNFIQGECVYPDSALTGDNAGEAAGEQYEEEMESVEMMDEKSTAHPEEFNDMECEN